ncbi:MAG: hypothetical protein ACR2NH_08450 [Solirubrobacteraceae bacterium]
MASVSAPATNGWTTLTIAQPTGEAPRIRQVFIARANDGGNRLYIDDLSFDNPPGPPPPPPPDARVATVAPSPVTGRVIAFDPTASAARLGTIARYEYDFDGSNRFAASCPPSVPVAYKIFDTPGPKTVGVRVQDSNGSLATTQSSFSLTGPSRTRPSLNPELAPLSKFWCGDRGSVADIATPWLPLRFNSEVRAVGMDITQGVVPDPPRPSGLTFLRFRALNNDKQDPRDNRITWMQRDGKTIVRVYASAVVAPPGDRVPDVQMMLYGTRGGELPGSPLLSETGPLSVPLGPPYTTHAMRIGYDPVQGALPAFTFTLPSSWTQGKLNLRARPVLVGRRLTRECSTAACALNRQAFSGDLQFNDTGLTIIRTVAMTPGAVAPMRSPSTIFDQAANLSPVAVLPTPYQATIDISPASACVAPPTDPKKCDDPNGIAQGLMDTWTTNNKPFISREQRFKVMTIGVHASYSRIQGYAVWPQDPGCSPRPNGALCETADVSPVAHVDVGRPLTSVAHEMFPGFGRNHADDSSASACGGKGEGKPDARGHLQGIGLDRHAGSGGSLTQPYRLISPNIPGRSEELRPQYDLMSYCANNSPEDDSWLSPYNWNAIAGDWIFDLKRASQSSALLGLRAAAAGPALEVTGYTDGSGTHISHVKPRGSGRPAPGDSAYSAVVRDSAGNVVGDAPLHVTYGHSDPLRKGDSPIPVATFRGTVPAAGAQQLEVSSSGQVVARAARSAHAPSVRLLSPRGGTIGRARTVAVRWRAADADRDPLTVFVDYSSDGGRRFRNVFMGPNRGTVALPSRYFTGSSNARIMVRVNDGFNERSIGSGRIRAAGSAPAVTIVNPRPGQRMLSDASLYLSGNAFDDAFKQLKGPRLRWMIGRRLLGVGESVTTTDLPPGRPRIRLLARDARGRTGSASVRVAVSAARPFFVRLTTPARLSRRSRSIRVTLATNVSSILRAGGRRFNVGRRNRTFLVPVKPGSGKLRLLLALSSHGRSASRTLEVPRG